MDAPEILGVEEAMPEPVTPSLAQVKTAERVPEPVDPQFTQSRAAQNLWEGFASSNEQPQDGAENREHAQAHSAGVPHGTPRLFGRRHANA